MLGLGPDAQLHFYADAGAGERLATDEATRHPEQPPEVQLALEVGVVESDGVAAREGGTPAVSTIV